eukprot:1134513-Pelagomonas_calceolata.AAC.1
MQPFLAVSLPLPVQQIILTSVLSLLSQIISYLDNIRISYCDGSERATTFAQSFDNNQDKSHLFSHYIQAQDIDSSYQLLKAWITQTACDPQSVPPEKENSYMLSNQGWPGMLASNYTDSTKHMYKGPSEDSRMR